MITSSECPALEPVAVESSSAVERFSLQHYVSLGFKARFGGVVDDGENLVRQCKTGGNGLMEAERRQLSPGG
ncbi:MAG: hypothetical protein PHI23_00795 [Candidatus Peribacteraceae bacterium]|nr:hypothetical protein [Candidatus Peribacteraceae bacterium]